VAPAQTTPDGEEDLLLNELAQWAVLIVLAVLVLGLVRQLGDFLVPPRERLARSRGPAIGDLLPHGLLPDSDVERLADAMAARGYDWAAVIVVDEECPECELLLDGLSGTARPIEAPIVAMSSRAAPEHLDRLNRVADVVVVDGEALGEAGLDVRPFVLIVDRSRRVLHKQVATSLRDVVREWRGDTTPEGAASTPTEGETRARVDVSPVILHSKGDHA
jgi:hypothetical protein